MRKGPPGMTLDRWALYRRERRRDAGEVVDFNPREIGMLQVEAEEANRIFSVDELRKVYGEKGRP